MPLATAACCGCGGGLPPFSGGSPPYDYKAAATRVSRRAAALPKEPSHHRWGVARSAQAMALEGLSLRMGVSSFEGRRSLRHPRRVASGTPRAPRPRGASRHTRLAEALAFAAQRAWQRRPSGTARSGRRAARRPQPQSLEVETTPPAHRRASQNQYRKLQRLGAQP